MKKKTAQSTVIILPFQDELRPAIPTVYGTVDYKRMEEQLGQIDRALVRGGLEREFLELCNKKYLEGIEEEENIDLKQLSRYQRKSRVALRCNILRKLLGEDCRGMSLVLALSPLYQWFCCIDKVDGAKIPSKTSINEFERWVDPSQIRQLTAKLLLGCSDPRLAHSGFELENEMELERVWMDSTCLECNIHFPVDWVLLRDGVRTLMKATVLIRKRGLNCRMEAPESFMRRMNRLCMEMIQQRRKADGKKQRKKVLRQMKKLSRIVMGHAQRHRDALERNYEQTDWTRRQAQRVMERIDGIMLQMPAAIKQAHERLIGERTVANDQKILSFYESEVEVMVRGKAHAEVEFGNKLLLVEQEQGLIVDWHLSQQNPSDIQILSESLERMESMLGEGKIKTLTADRGFHSKKVQQKLMERGIYDGTCPRDPQTLSQRMKGWKFRGLQKRRAQTEGRIGIFKNVFLGGKSLRKGHSHREMEVSWSVLSHNLWVISRKAISDKTTKIKMKEAA